MHRTEMESTSIAASDKLNEKSLAPDESKVGQAYLRPFSILKRRSRLPGVSRLSGPSLLIRTLFGKA